MGLDESDRLSLLALIVAIVALIVSAWQLAQQLFATAADGKRFCQASVMGVWARKTRLSWRWSQIRFETKYTTPELRLLSGVTDSADEDDHAQKNQRPRFWYRVPVIRWLIEVSLGPSSDWSGYFEITSNRNDVPLELRKTRPPSVRIEPDSSAERWSLWFLSWWDGSYHVDSSDVVSWPKLLERLYKNQVSSVRKVMRSQPNGAASNLSGKELESGTADTPNEDSPCPEITHMETQNGEDRIVVRLVERSWDLVPPDVVRPLAHSTVGSIITIVHRLGMSWQADFDPNQGQMNASGCGHTITSETVRGLGLVLKYSYHHESIKVRNTSGTNRGVTHQEYLSPTISSDKLHCGILTIDGEALPCGVDVDDIDLIDGARKLDVAGLLHRLNISRHHLPELREKEKQNPYGVPLRNHKHVIEDVVSMLSPIPTMPTSRARWIVWPYRSRMQPFTPTRQRRGLEEIRAQIASFAAQHKQAARLMEDRDHPALKGLDASPSDYLDELLNMMILIDSCQDRVDDHTQQLLCTTYDRIRSIHEKTSEVFASIKTPPAAADDEEEPLPFLMALVAAHVTLATKYGKVADDAIPPEDQGLSDGNSLTYNENRRRFVKELARLYFDDLGNEKTVRKHIRRSGYVEILEPGIVPSLWCMLLVRSACWFLSVRIRMPETQIPSYWYNSRTPVYIT
jgi:hypothetical protein